MDYEKKYKEALERAKQFSEKPYLEDSKGIVEYIFPELQESEDERIRKSLIDMLKNDEKCYLKEIAWLEKQGEHAKFRDSIQVGDKVTRNQDGVLVNLSQLNRVAKKDEKQGEHKLAEWSEEDEQYLLVCKNALAKYQVSDKWDATIISRWLEDKLKSLKGRYTWKPSDAQMIVLNDIIINGHLSNANERILKGLQEQLKKLKG